MYLKTLELQGFKSFPDKTVIEFDKGMTAIVGANGSGKSNISDAVRWVLGEMSAKSLRGNKMEDVIFNGSSKRKPASFAEVIMTIDNSDFLMKIDYDEVSVGRRLYRTGESEYYLNRQKVRLKDVVDLFLNTGIGREGYSVISQGKIAEIISLKGNERRELFEEAAGISRFRYRKSEAETKLMSVTENSVRINDILSEVQSRIPKLEEQSKKAKAYLEINQEKRGLELGIWSKRIAKIEETEKREGENLSSKEKELGLIGDEIDSLDRNIDSMYVESQKANMESEILRTRINDLAKENSDDAGRISVLENEIRHFDLKRAETENLKITGNERREKLNAEKEISDRELGSVSESIAQLQKNSEENIEKETNLALFLGELRKEEEELFGEKNSLFEHIQQKSLELKEKEGIGIAREERKKVLSEMKNSILAEKEEREKEFELKKKILSEKSSLLEAERKKNGNTNLLIYREKESLEEKDNALSREKLAVLEKEKLRDTLQRMERLLEGFSESVKEVMQAKDKTLSGICGPISSIITTDEEFVVAIETSLGGNMQNVIVEDEKSAKEAIAFLKATKSGRATFLPLTTVKGGKWRCDNIKSKGFIGIASELCRFDEKFAPAVEHLLGKVIICDNIESAAEIARGEGYGVKIVTLDGQVINAGGSFTGGQTQAKSGVISRTRDIKKLESEIADIQKKIGILRTEIENSEKLIASLRKEEETSARNIEIFIAEKNEAEKEATILSDKIDITSQKLAEVLREENEINEFSAIKSEIERTLAEEKQNYDRRIAEIEGRLEKISVEKAKALEEKENIISEKGRIGALLVSETERLERLNGESMEILSRMEELKSESENADAVLLDTENKKKAALEEIKLLSSKKDEISSEIQEDQKKLEILSEKINHLGEESNKSRLKQKEKISAKEKLLDEAMRLRGMLSGISKEKNDITAKLFEEYELEIDCEEFINAKNIDTDALGGNSHLTELRRMIRNIGPVNLESVEELKEATERFEFLNNQYSDIMKSKEELEKLIFDLEGTMREMFSETFESIRFSFREIFSELFGGGMADIELTNKDDLLNCGVEIKVQPPGKVIKNLSLLSGGEQAFVAIALYMALLKTNPSPFCIFDEIESALDEANVKRFAQYIKKHNDKTQFIVITHRRGTMEEADTLYGITMQEKGVSDFLRLDAGSVNSFAQDKQ